MKSLILVAMLVCLGSSQRAPFAGGSRNRYPVVIKHYQDEQQAAIANMSGPAVVNRVDESLTPTTSTIPPNLPVDALGDVDLVNRIKTWPREKQPFWYLNWQQIEAHRGGGNRAASQRSVEPSTRILAQPEQQQVPRDAYPKSFYAGKR